MIKMTAFDEQGFEKKLMNLKDTQESVSQLSHWCLVNKQHHKKIVTLWLSVLKKVKVESRLTLFHLANDVIQYSKRKNLEFVESWGTALQRATPMVRDEKVQKKILRIFKIWGERNIYEETFLTDLCGLLTTTTKRSSAQAQSHSKSHHHEKPVSVAIPLVFEPQNLFLKIRDCVKLENDTDLKMKYVNECPLALNDVDSLRASLKDRSHGDEAVGEVDDAIERMKAYEEALKIEVHERRTLIELLRHGETFYENERGEAKVVFNAYRNFGSRVKSVKRKLDELIPTLSSPIPSPDVNAPSPSPDSDIDLPNDEDLSGIVECLQNSSSSDGEADPDLPKYKLKHLSARHRRRGLPLPIPGDVTLQNINLDEEYARRGIDHYLYELALNESQNNSDIATDDEDFRLWFSSDEEESHKHVKSESVSGTDPVSTPVISDRDPRIKKFLRPEVSVERSIPDSSSCVVRPERSLSVDSDESRLVIDVVDTGAGRRKGEPDVEPVTSSQENESGLKAEPAPRTPSSAPRTPSPKPRTFDPEMRTFNLEVGTSYHEVGTPYPEGEIRGPEVGTPIPEMTNPNPEVVQPSPNVRLPDPEVGALDPEVETSDPKVGTPNLEVGTPDFDVGTPDFDVGTPDFDVETPDFDVETPDLDVDTPDLDVDTPDFDVETPNLDVETPDPEVGTPRPDVGTPNTEVGIPAPDVGTPPKLRIPFPQQEIPSEMTILSPNLRVPSPTPETSSPLPRTPPSCISLGTLKTLSPIPRTPSLDTFKELCSTPVPVTSSVLETYPEESLCRRTCTSDDNGLKPDSLSENELLILRSNILNELETECVPMDISEEDLPGECDISSVLECMDMDLTP